MEILSNEYSPLTIEFVNVNAATSQLQQASMDSTMFYPSQEAYFLSCKYLSIHILNLVHLNMSLGKGPIGTKEIFGLFWDLTWVNRHDSEFLIILAGTTSYSPPH